jgi:hypothetical protein
LHFGIEPPRAGSPQPGSAGLGVYQAGSLRSASRLIEIMPFKAADPRILLSGQAMFDVGYFPPNTRRKPKTAD